MTQEIDAERSPEGRVLTDLIFKIFRANGRLLRVGDTLVKDLGLTSARWQVLGAVEFSPKTVAQIARDYELTRQGILWVVQSMVRDGFVELVKNPDHRRAKLVRTTAKGREIFNETVRRQIEWSNRISEGFSVKELSKAIEVMGKLSDVAFVGLGNADEED